MLFFITPTNRTEVYNIISFLNRGKSDAPNSIPTKTLKLLNKGKSDQIRFLFNQYFFFRLFPPILKTNKIIPKSKGSKLDFQSIDQFLHSSTLIVFFKNLCITDFIVFLKIKNSYNLSNLAFDRNIQLLMLLFI